MGLTSEQLVTALCQAINPDRPQIVPTSAAEKFVKVMKQSASMLGRQKVTVEPFLLAKWPVKNAEYEAYLKTRLANNVKIRVPFGWWRYGCKDDYNKRLPDIMIEFPTAKNPALEYWDRHGADLPGALVDAEGNSIADKPLSFIDYREVNVFAAYIGMRIPTEAEWTRAARGDGTHLWSWGKDDPATDVYTEKALKLLKIFSSREQALKPVGTVPAGTGPFGHLDMFGQVWQFVASDSYHPMNGAEVFAAEWKRLQKDKTGALLSAPPIWNDQRIIAKGGSYLSGQEPHQLLIDARAPMLRIDVLEGLGLRLAKSLRPGYDVLFSMLRGIYNRSHFTDEQTIDLSSQAGGERYEIGADGFPTAYHAISFGPVNWLVKEKSIDVDKLKDRSQVTPLLLGTMVSTADLLEPKVPAGIYSVLYRAEGMPNELKKAIEVGHKELERQKKEPDKAGDGANDKAKKGYWREVLARYGLTDKDFEGIKEPEELQFVRVSEFQVSTAVACFLLHNNDGKVLAVVPTKGPALASSSNFVSELNLEADANGKSIAKFHFGVPLLQKDSKRVIGFHLQVTLDRAAPTAELPWRLPTR